MGVSPTLRPPLPPGKNRYPLYRRLGGPQGRSGRVENLSPQLGFDPLTVQPVASRYTDWAIRPTYGVTTDLKFRKAHKKKSCTCHHSSRDTALAGDRWKLIQAGSQGQKTKINNFTLLCVSRPILTLWRRNYYYFFNFSTSVYKMWIIQEPKKLAVWNKLHFEEKKTESLEHV